MRRNQSINLPMSADASAINTGGLQVGLTGATNDGVLLFAATEVIRGQGFTVTNVVGPAANDGTTIAISRSGIYTVELGYQVQASATVIGGMSLNQSVSLNAAPTFATAGVLDVNTCTNPAATVTTVKLSTTIVVRRTVAGAVGGALVRLLATDGAGAAPAGILAASAYYRITKIAELYA